MPLKLDQKGAQAWTVERPEYGVVIKGRTLTASKRAEIVGRNTDRRGNTDLGAVNAECLSWSILEWEGIEAENAVGDVVLAPITKASCALLPGELADECLQRAQGINGTKVATGEEAESAPLS